MLAAYQIEMVDRDEIKLVGLSMVESLNQVISTHVGVKLREQLASRKSELEYRAGSGMYLIQIYPCDGEWTPDVPYEHLFAYEVTSFEQVPPHMATYTLPAGRYAKVVHHGPESKLAATYDYINSAIGGRPIDIEYWSDIDRLEEEDHHIDIYIPAAAE